MSGCTVGNNMYIGEVITVRALLENEKRSDGAITGSIRSRFKRSSPPTAVS